MVHPVTANVIPMLHHLVQGLLPFAEAQGVALKFETEIETLATSYHPENIVPDLTQLLCRVVTFTPEGHEVTLRASIQGAFLQLYIENTGTNLAHLSEIVAKLNHEAQATALEGGGTKFELEVPIQNEQPTEAVPQPAPSSGGHSLLKPFFAEMRKRLSSHFSDPVNLEKAVSGRNPRDGAFLQKVNAIILAHIDREDFDVKRLCKSLVLSRTQLYRRLCPLIKQPPAKYIRLVRLQKAKELLEAGELTIGEIALNTGFQSQSHFTRLFLEHYGMKPSSFKRQPRPKP
jgi:AraC-like DNA-binding protein